MIYISYIFTVNYINNYVKCTALFLAAIYNQITISIRRLTDFKSETMDRCDLERASLTYRILYNFKPRRLVYIDYT